MSRDLGDREASINGEDLAEGRCREGGAGQWDHITDKSHHLGRGTGHWISQQEPWVTSARAV